MNTSSNQFQSPLAMCITNFLIHHRALGKRFEAEENELRLLDHYLIDTAVRSIDDLTPALLANFLLSRPRQRTRSYNHLINVLHRLFDWMVAQQLLSRSPFTAPSRRVTEQRIPFLFDQTQMRRLLVAASELPDNAFASCRGEIYRIIFSLMYGLGLRVGEISRLCYKDVDLVRKLLIIRQTKFSKSRLVPFGPKIGMLLFGYLHRAETATDKPPSNYPLFSFANNHHRHIAPKTISRVFHDLLPLLALDAPPSVSLPRLHCLRHSFAVNCLLRWYRSGIDPQRQLIYLSTFLGHVNPASTSVYLTITADLLDVANQRFASFAAPLSQEAE